MTPSEAIAGFDQKITDFSLANARAMAEMSLAAYQIAPNFVPIGGFIGRGIRIRSARDIQAIVSSDESSIIVAFRGTQSMADWMVDVMIAQTRFAFPKYPIPDIGLVHTGFFHGMLMLFDTLVADIVELRSNNQPIFVTGHSLGGALAVLFTGAFREFHGIVVSGLYTFGCPRVGNHALCEAFDDLFKSIHFAFRNWMDLVTRVAPRIVAGLPPMIYDHCGQTKYFDKNGALHENESEFAMFVDSFEVGMHFGELLRQPIADHSLDLYIARIEAATAAQTPTP